MTGYSPVMSRDEIIRSYFKGDPHAMNRAMCETYLAGTVPEDWLPGEWSDVMAKYHVMDVSFHFLLYDLLQEMRLKRG